jgi:hypothetical protein
MLLLILLVSPQSLIADSPSLSTPVRIERLLGQGTFGKVVAAKTIKTNHPSLRTGDAVAVKIMFVLPFFSFVV